MMNPVALDSKYGLCLVLTLLAIPAFGLGAAPRTGEQPTIWKTSSWKDGSGEFRNARKELDAYVGKWKGFHKGAPVCAKAISAYREFAAAPLNSRLLYRASALYVAAETADYEFRSKKECLGIRRALVKGWNSIRVIPAYEYTRLGYVFMVYYGGESAADEVGLALLNRGRNDPLVSRAYIHMVFGHPSYAKAWGERSVKLAERLIADDPSCPANWFAHATAYWIRAGSQARDLKADMAIAQRSLLKCEAMLPADHPIRKQKQLDLWKRAMANFLKPR